MATNKKNQKTLPVSVSDTELGNITQNNPNVVLSLQDRVIAALRDGMKSYINAGRLMRTAVTSEYWKEKGFTGSRAWLETLPLSVANSYNMMGAASVADFAGVSDSYLADVGQLAVYHIGRSIKEIEKKNLKAALVGLLGKIRNADNVSAFKAIAEFKREHGLKLTETDDKALHGPVPKASGNGTVTLTGGDKTATKPAELTVKFRGISFDDACKVLVHSGVDVTDDKAIEKWFAKLMVTLAAKFEAPAATTKTAKNAKTATASNDEVSPEDAAYMAEDAERLATMNAVN